MSQTSFHADHRATAEAAYRELAEGLLHEAGALGLEVRDAETRPMPGQRARAREVLWWPTSRAARAEAPRDEVAEPAPRRAVTTSDDREPEQDWSESWKALIRSAQVGRLWVGPPWEAASAPAGKVPSSSSRRWRSAPATTPPRRCASRRWTTFMRTHPRRERARRGHRHRRARHRREEARRRAAWWAPTTTPSRVELAPGERRLNANARAGHLRRKPLPQVTRHLRPGARQHPGQHADGPRAAASAPR